MTLHPDEHELASRIDALPREIAPARDLWPHVRAGIDSRASLAFPQRRGLWSWRTGGLAAAAAVLVMTTAIVTARVVGKAAPAGTSVAATDAALGESSVIAVAAVDQSFRPTVNELTAALAASRGKLAPATVTRVEYNLRLIDAAIGEVRDALARDPGNAALVQMLTTTYRQKVDLLRRATELAPAP
jgi:hypothetical protein